MPMKAMAQVNPLTARLRDILRNYSSAQLLNECVATFVTLAHLVHGGP